MCDFHYNYLKVKYGNKAKLLFTDTGSYKNEIAALYDDLYRVNDFFIFGNYPEDSNDKVNKKVIGKMKDEIKEAPNEKLLD